MSTSNEFDTLFPHDVTGEITATITDLDDTPNHVLDKNQAWQIKVRWSLTNHNFPSADLGAISGNWKVTAYLEAIGVPAPVNDAYEGEATAPVTISFGNPNPTQANWNTTLTVPGGTVTVGGVYKVTVMLAFLKTNNTPTDMVGFVECPPIAFHA